MSEHQLWNELGNVYINSGAYDQAIKSYEKAIEVNPEFGWAYSNMALAYMRLGESENSIPFYQRSIELLEEFSDKAVAWHRLGNSYQVMDDTQNAILAFQRAVDLDLDNTVYRHDLAVAMAEYAYEVDEEPEEVDVVQKADVVKEAEEFVEETKKAEIISDSEKLEEIAAVLEVEAVEKASAVSEALAEAVEESIEETDMAEEAEKEAEIEDVVLSDEEEIAEVSLAHMEEVVSVKSDFTSWLEKTMEKLSLNAVQKKSAAFEDNPIIFPEGVSKEEVVAELMTVVENQASRTEIATDEEADAETPEESVDEAITKVEFEHEEISQENKEVVERIPLEFADEIKEEVEVVEEVEAKQEEVEEVTLEKILEENEDVVEEVSLELTNVIEEEAEAIARPVEEVEAKQEEIEEVALEDILEENEKVIEAIPSVPAAIAEDLIPVFNDMSTNGLDADVDDLMSELSKEIALVQEDEKADEDEWVIQATLKAEKLEYEAIFDELVDDFEDDAKFDVEENDDEEDEEIEVADEGDDEDEDTLFFEEEEKEVIAAFYAAQNGQNGNGKNGTLELNTAKVWGDLGNIFFSAGVFDGALIAYEKAIKLDTQFAPVLNNLALLHVRNGEYLQAVDLYRKSIELLDDAPEKSVTWNNLGNTYRVLEEYEQAEKAYRKADELDTNNSAIEKWMQFGLLSTVCA